MRIRPSETHENTYLPGHFSRDDAFVVNQVGGDSPFGAALASLGSDYFVEIAPDGSGRSWFHGRPITSPNGTGKAWYMKDQESGETWSAFHGPTCTKTDEYEVSFSPGSVTSYSLLNKIACTVTIAASPDSPCEIWRVRLENRSAVDRSISFTTYARPRAGSALECRYLPKERALVMRRPLESLESERTGRHVEDLIFFQSCTLTPARYEVDKNRFIGEGRNLQNPEFLDITTQNEVDPIAESAAASFSVEVDLPIEGEAEFAFCFGAARSVEEALDTLRKHSTVHEVDKAINASREHWRELSSTLKVESPDPVFDALINTWMPLEACAEWIKEHAGTPHLDPYRAADALRCLTPFYATSPDVCRETLLNFAARLSVLGSYSAGSDSQVTLPPNELLWLAVCTASYVAETGDDTVLGRSISLTDGPALTLAEHCERAIRMCLYDKHAVNDYAELRLLEKALQMWALLTEDRDEFNSHIEAVKKRRIASRPEYPEERSLPRRLQHLQSTCPSLSGPDAADILAGCTSPARSDQGSICLAYSAITEQMLGIEATSLGLILDPHLPESWQECKVTRKFRGDTYTIRIQRANMPAGANPSIVADGEPILGKMLPYTGDGQEHRIDVIIP